jgi:hypothetical protein
MRPDGSAARRVLIGTRRRGKNLCLRARQQGTAKQRGRGSPLARIPASPEKEQEKPDEDHLTPVVAGIRRSGRDVLQAQRPGPVIGPAAPDHLTLESAIQVNLSKETVRLPLYPGTANGQKVWYVLLDASDAGLAHDLGVNYAPKLANIAISGPAAVQTRACLHSSPQLTGSGADHAGDERKTRTACREPDHGSPRQHRAGRSVRHSGEPAAHSPAVNNRQGVPLGIHDDAGPLNLAKHSLPQDDK